MKKWILLTLFLIATGVVSIYFNLRNPADALQAQAATLMDKHQYADAIPVLNKLVQQNQGNPQAVAVIQQSIAVCQAKLNYANPVSAPLAATDDPAPSSSGPPQILIDPNTGNPRTPHPKPVPGETLAMTIQQLGNFPFEPNTDTTVPPDVQALNGAKITLPGYINLFDQSEALTEFAITPSLNGCCFGQPAGIQHTIICLAPASLHLQFTPVQVLLTGRIIVKCIRENDFTHTVFQLQVDSMTAADQ